MEKYTENIHEWKITGACPAAEHAQRELYIPRTWSVENLNGVLHHAAQVLHEKRTLGTVYNPVIAG